jgi:hypothetical protein
MTRKPDKSRTARRIGLVGLDTLNLHRALLELAAISANKWSLMAIAEIMHA